MRDSFWEKLSNLAGLFVLAAIFGLTIFVANIEIKDLDIWLHIGMGRHIVENGFQVPGVDILSHTIAGKFWVNHEWLFQVIVYFLYNLAGADGLIMMQVILVTLTMAILVFLGYNREKQLSTLFILLFVAFVYHGRFTFRPDLYSLLFFALYILFLSFYLERKWVLWAFFAVQILWTNMHGFFFFGPLFVLIGLLAEALKRRVRLPYQWNKTGRLTNEEYSRLKMIFVAVVLACLVNPLTFKGAWYPLRVFFSFSGESKIFFQRIVELQPPITRDTLFSLDPYYHYRMLILLSFASFVYNRRRIDIGPLIFWLVFLLFSLSAVRNLVFFAFAAYLVFVTNAMNISLNDLLPIRVTDKKFIHLTAIFIKIFLLMWIIQYGMDISTNGYFDFDRYERKSEFGGISQRQYPDKAVDFLVENDIRGNFFNDFNTGAYLVGRCFPNIKVFIDGRTEVYGPEFFQYYEKAWGNESVDTFKDALDRYAITGALLQSVRQAIPKKILKFMQDSPEWVPVYFDYDGVIYLKDIPQNKEMIEKFRVDFAGWKPKGLDRLRLGNIKLTPYQNLHRAYTLDTLGFAGPALAEVEEGLKVDPQYNLLYKLKGKIYAEKKDFPAAFENFRIAVVLNPGDRDAHMKLALAYSDMGEHVYAIRQYNKIIERWPDDVSAYYLRTQNYVKQQKYQDALISLKEAIEKDPKADADIVAICELLKGQGALDETEKALQFAVSRNKNSAKLFYQLAMLFKTRSDRVKAKEMFEKTLELNPGNEAIRQEIEELTKSF